MKAIVDIEKRRRGRPRTDATPVMVRLTPDLIEGLDHFIADMSDQGLTRPEAIRQVLSHHLQETGHLLVATHHDDDHQRGLDALITGKDGQVLAVQAKTSKPRGKR